jgi:hypothetical protein
MSGVCTMAIHYRNKPERNGKKIHVAPVPWAERVDVVQDDDLIDIELIASQHDKDLNIIPFVVTNAT